MKIAYCIPGLWNAGGMERVLTEKVNWLSQHTNWEITIITTEIVPLGKKPCYFELDKRVKVKEMLIDFDADYQSSIFHKTLQHLRKQRKYKHQLTEWLIQEKTDVCISLCGKEIEWLGQTPIPCRRIAEIHFAIDYKEQWLLQTHQGRIWKWGGKILTQRLIKHMHHMDQLVVLTKADQAAWKREGIEQVEVIVNPCSIQPKQEGAHDQKIILAVGRLEPQKGFDWLIEAWSKIAVHYPDWKVKICGEGSQKKELRKRIEELGLSQSMMMEGLSKDLERDYQQSRIFVLSSRYEGLPLALMEAMSAGLCCIAMDCKQGPNELIENNKTGWLIPVGDIEAMAQQIAAAIDNTAQCEALAKAARAYALSHFGIDHLMHQWVEIIKQA